MSIAPPKGKKLFSKLWIKFSSKRKLAKTGDLLRLSAGATLMEDANYRRDLLDDTTFLHDRQTSDRSLICNVRRGLHDSYRLYRLELRPTKMRKQR